MTDSLLSRLQSLSAPSREIDEEIALANGWTTFSDEDGTYWCGPNYRLHMAPPRYTESVDAALALIPEGYAWDVCSYEDKFKGKLWPDVHTLYRGFADTPAIALLIAIIKAKEKSK